MKPKVSRMGKKALSLITALSLSVMMFILPARTSLTANAGTVANLITGRWSAIALEYIERGTMRAIGSAAAHAENETIATILTTTKKFLGSPMSNTLADIKKMCAEMNAKLDKISAMMENNQNVLTAKLDAVTEQNLKDNYTAKKKELSDINDRYVKVISLFEDFNNKAQAVDLNDPQSINDLRLAYDSLNSIYETANGITTHTGLQFNFSDDVTGIASIISAYSPTYNVDDNISNNIAIDNKDGWGSRSNGPSMIDYYYDSIMYSDAFDHEVYSDMSAQFSYAAGIASTYLEAYSLYVSYAAQRIYEGNAEGITTERDKQRMVDNLWKDYDKASYIINRALVQMIDDYDSKLSGIMRGYDINTTIHYDNIKDSIEGSLQTNGKAWSDVQTSTKSKTSTRMQAYQLRPYGSTTAYALRKTNSSQPAVQIKDLSYYAFKYRVNTFPFYNNKCTGYSCDYYNLMRTASSSPTGWNPLSSTNQLNGLVNTKAFEKVFTTESKLCNFAEYLKEHGITNDLPKMDSSNPYALSKNYEWDYKGNGYIGNWDIDMKFYNITSLKKGSNMSESLFDMEDGIDDIKNEETSIFYTGEPQVAVYLTPGGQPAAEAAEFQYSAVDYKGNAVSAQSGRNVLKSGGTITLRVKPNDGKYIKNLRLCDRFVYDEDHSKGTLTQYISEDDALYRSDCGIYPDTDGYYTFKINVPFRDGSVVMELADVPTKIHSATLEESESVVDATKYYDADGGILTFGNMSGEKTIQANTGDPISVSVVPFTGYKCTGIEVKDSAGNQYTASPEDMSSYSPVHGQKLFSFTMPDTDVTVRAVYEEAYTVELSSDEHSSLSFINSTGTVDETTDVRSYETGETVKLKVSTSNGYCLSKVTISDYTNREYLSCKTDDETMSFKMPDGNVVVEAVSEKMDMNKYTASIREDSTGVIGFIDSEGNPCNVNSLQISVGDEVRFTSDFKKIAIKDSTGRDIAYTALSDKTYSFIMPSYSVELSAEVYTASIAESSSGRIRFVDESNNVQSDLTIHKEKGSEVRFRFEKNDCHDVLSVLDAEGEKLSITKVSDDIYSFVMPDRNVEIYFTQSETEIHDYVNGICSVCGDYQPAVLNSDGNYEIGNAGNFLWYAALVNDEHDHAVFDTRDTDANAVLVDDIDLENRMFTNIGKFTSGAVAASEDRYTGSFDGQGHTIKNFFSDGTYNHWGIFGMSYCRLKNLTVKGKFVLTEDELLDEDTMLAIVAYAGVGSEISDVTSYLEFTNNINNAELIGGIVGVGMGSLNIQRCVFAGSIESTDGEQRWVGGIFGDIGNNNVIKDCANIGTINVRNGKAGGIGGVIEMGENSLSDCYNYGNVSSYDDAEDITASSSAKTKLSNCYHLGDTDENNSDLSAAKAERFSSGEIGYKLNHNVTDGTQVWYQNIDNGETPDNYPLPDKTRGTIYFVEAENRYSNYPDGKAPQPEPKKVSISIDTDKFIYDENGIATSYLTFDSTGASDPITADQNTEVVIRYTADEKHVLKTIKAIGQTSGNETELAIGDGTVICPVADEDILIVPSFEEMTLPVEPVKKGISTYEELVEFASNVNSNNAEYGNANVWLENNITAPDDSKWTQGIGTDGAPFNGTFDGKGYCILGLNIDIKDQGALFGEIGENGVVKDLAVIDCNYESMSDNAGGIAAVNNGTIDHCTSGINTISSRIIKTISGAERTVSSMNSSVYGALSGGIAAINNGTITGSRSSAFVIGTECGGIAGTNNGTIYGSANNGPIGKDSVNVKRCGGIAAYNNGTIASSYSSGNINGASGTIRASVAAQNNSNSVTDVFYAKSGKYLPVADGSVTQLDSSCQELDVKYMLTPDFAEKLNSVTDDTVNWKHIEYKSTLLNQGFPIIRGRYIENLTVVDDAKIKIKAAMIKAMMINFNPFNLNSASYNTMRSAAGTRTMTCAYDLTAADSNGLEIPAELWCEGITVSIPVSSTDVQIITLNEKGEAVTFAPDSIENGWATFTLAEPTAFAVTENTAEDTSTGSNSSVSDNTDVVRTGDSSFPVTAAFAVMLVSMLIALVVRRKKERE